MTRGAKTKRAEREELAMLVRLRFHHGYMFGDLRLAAERSASMFRRSPGGTFKVTPAVCVRLIVPVDSAFGKDIIASRKRAERKKARALASKARRTRRTTKATR